MEADRSLLLSVGRKDDMTREFLGSDNQHLFPQVTRIVLSGNRPGTKEIPYLLKANSLLEFTFDADASAEGQKVVLQLHTADQSEDFTAVTIALNGRRLTQELPRGQGLQYDDAAHLANPRTLTFVLEASDLVGKNSRLTITTGPEGLVHSERYTATPFPFSYITNPLRLL